MLVDYIDPAKLPWVIVWLDWNAYAYRSSLIVCLVIAIWHYWNWQLRWGNTVSFSGLSLAFFIGFCCWSVYCAARYGYAVG